MEPVRREAHPEPRADCRRQGALFQQRRGARRHGADRIRARGENERAQHPAHRALATPVAAAHRHPHRHDRVSAPSRRAREVSAPSDSKKLACCTASGPGSSASGVCATPQGKHCTTNASVVGVAGRDQVLQRLFLVGRGAGDGAPGAHGRGKIYGVVLRQLLRRPWAPRPSPAAAAAAMRITATPAAAMDPMPGQASAPRSPRILAPSAGRRRRHSEDRRKPDAGMHVPARDRATKRLESARGHPFETCHARSRALTPTVQTRSRCASRVSPSVAAYTTISET